MLTILRRRINDVPEEVWTDAELTLLINQALSRLAIDVLKVDPQAFFSIDDANIVANQYLYAKPSNMVHELALLKLAEDASIREFALRALTDRRSQLANVPLAPFVAALKDENPRVQAQAIVSLGRIGNAEAADEFKRAASLTRNERERAMLLARAAPDVGAE